MSIDVHFWGTRGSYFMNGPEFQEFGGHTSCISLHHEDDLYIIDAGSGLVSFSNALTQWFHDGGIPPRKAYFFLSHLHMDHICGLPTFHPLWNPDFEAYFYCGVAHQYGGLEAVLESYFAPPFFPVPWNQFPCEKTHFDFHIGETLSPTGHSQVRTILLNHPGHASGFAFHLDGKKIVYLCDTNHDSGFLDHFIDFSENADLLIYDATFDSKKHAQYAHYGHSTWEKACEVALKAKVDQLALTHHDIFSTDAHLRLVEEAAKIIIPDAFAARCGQKLILP